MFCYRQIWKVEKGLDGKVIVEFLFNFVRYIKAVNVVRFFLNGEILVLGGDGEYCCILEFIRNQIFVCFMLNSEM